MTTPRVFRIATRGSRLALWQAHAVADRLRAAGAQTEIAVFMTTGDRSQHAPVAGDDSKRQFVKEIEDALLRGDADLAVHSAKDLPVVLPDGLGVAACLPREDPRDGLVLPRPHDPLTISTRSRGSAVARRSAPAAYAERRNWRRFRPGAFAPIRGNVDTRLAKLDAGGFDALVLACAGLRRLGFGERSRLRFPSKQCVPAPGQGIVAIEIRIDDAGAGPRFPRFTTRRRAGRSRPNARSSSRSAADASCHSARSPATGMERSRCWRWQRRSTARARCAVR